MLPSAPAASASLLKWPSITVSVARMIIWASWVAAIGTARRSSSRASASQAWWRPAGISGPGIGQMIA